MQIVNSLFRYLYIWSLVHLSGVWWLRTMILHHAIPKSRYQTQSAQASQAQSNDVAWFYWKLANWVNTSQYNQKNIIWQSNFQIRKVRRIWPALHGAIKMDERTITTTRDIIEEVAKVIISLSVAVGAKPLDEEESGGVVATMMWSHGRLLECSRDLGMVFNQAGKELSWSNSCRCLDTGSSRSRSKINWSTDAADGRKGCE